VRNWEVTEAVKGLLKEYEANGVKGVEGILSHQVRLSRRSRVLCHFSAGAWHLAALCSAVESE
jgi:hypothetical protein